jgi:hypothetical protein
LAQAWQENKKEFLHSNDSLDKAGIIIHSPLFIFNYYRGKSSFDCGRIDNDRNAQWRMPDVN